MNNIEPELIDWMIRCRYAEARMYELESREQERQRKQHKIDSEIDKLGEMPFSLLADENYAEQNQEALVHE